MVMSVGSGVIIYLYLDSSFERLRVGLRLCRNVRKKAAPGQRL